MATPIGNLADITLRALHALDRAALVACEDTRVTAQMLAHYGLHKPLLALHAHNENEGAVRVCAELAQGCEVAYASDAGTPGISDPGARLVAAAVQAGYRVVPLPGPSSATAALSVAGDAAAGGYAFVGFLPPRGAARRAALEQALRAEGQAQVVFESPHRIEALAAELAAAAPQRTVTAARELTKQFETVATMPAAQLPAWLAGDAHRRRGEFVVVVHAAPPAADAQPLTPDAERCLRLLLRELPLKQAVALAAEISGAPRNALYAEALRERAPPARA